MRKDLGFIGSSVDSTSLSATVTGLIITFSAVIIAIAHYFKLPLTDSDVAILAQQVGLIIGTLYTVFGLVRKFVVWLNERFANK